MVYFTFRRNFYTKSLDAKSFYGKIMNIILPVVHSSLTGLIDDVISYTTVASTNVDCSCHRITWTVCKITFVGLTKIK